MIYMPWTTACVLKLSALARVCVQARWLAMLPPAQLQAVNRLVHSTPLSGLCFSRQAGRVDRHHLHRHLHMVGWGALGTRWAQCSCRGRGNGLVKQLQWWQQWPSVTECSCWGCGGSGISAATGVAAPVARYASSASLTAQRPVHCTHPQRSLDPLPSQPPASGRHPPQDHIQLGAWLHL